MLYKKNSLPSLSAELFRNPTSEYRGTPFWAWNSDLKSDELKWQIEVFKQMGLGGFHMHVRTGMSTTYLSDEFMQLIKDCVEKAKQEKMLAWLYDEDRWPSGAAGGYVTKDRSRRQKSLVLSVDAGREDELIACYDVVLNADGLLESYKRICSEDAAEGTKWYAYVVIAKDDSWYNGQAYADTLDKETIEKFIEVTHEKYKDWVGGDFGEAVPAIFTDEPQFSRKRTVNNSTDTGDISLPWTNTFVSTYKEAYGEDILDRLPEIYWEKAEGGVSETRYRYHDCISEKFASAFADTIGKWCDSNGIALTGHMMEEPTLRSQTAALGDCMRSYRSFGLPGIDMLCANFEFSTAKQAQSATHQYGREGVLSELYGVTGWDCDFRSYKLQGDWQAALGVTVRVPHLSWVSMGGAAKRDYPASIHYQSPWYKEFSFVEDHFARVNTALTRGKPVVKVAVIHPVESFWLYWGPNDKTALVRENMDKRFLDMIEWLIKGSIDFDFICESLFPDQCNDVTVPIKVGEMEYDTVVVPACITLRSTTLERLEKFKAAGGRVIFMGDAPVYENAVPSERGKKLFDSCETIGYDRAALINALDSERTVTIRHDDGRLTDNLIYQLRRDNDCEWLFISQCRNPYNKDVISSVDSVITVKGEFIPEIYDTLTGDILPCGCSYKNGSTVIEHRFYDYDSLLLRLVPGRKEECCKCGKKCEKDSIVTFDSAVDYTLTEPNCMLLDLAEFALDGGDFMAEEEILRGDNVCRRILGMPERGGGCVQPWVIPAEKPVHSITMRFTVNSDIEVTGAKLALEDAEKASITFNGEAVANNINGWYVDKAIKTVDLPVIRKGANILTVTIPFGLRTDTEWCYIIGSFGVEVAGRTKKIVALPEKLAFGDVCTQGLPFYGGNIVYHIDAETEKQGFAVTASKYRGGFVKISADNGEAKATALPPYTALFDAAPGKHRVDVTLFGNRRNSFGAVHLTDMAHSWHGPGAWESSGERWSYEYQLLPLGLLAAPVIKE